MLLSSVTEVYRDYKAPSCGKSHLGTLVNAWNLFIEHCGDIPLDSVTPGHVYEFLQARMQAEHKPWSGMRALQFGRPVLREIFGLPRIRRPKRLVLGRLGVLHLDHDYALGVLQVGPASEVHDRVGDLIAFVRDAALVLVGETLHRNADQLGAGQEQAQALSSDPGLVELVAVAGGADGVYRRVTLLLALGDALGFGTAFGGVSVLRVVVDFFVAIAIARSAET